MRDPFSSAPLIECENSDASFVWPQVQLLVDGAPKAPPQNASNHRTVAGDHGFVFEFSCALIKPGAHTVTVTAYDSTGPGKKETWSDSVCVKGGVVVACAPDDDRLTLPGMLW
jgi:hypothetical protein